MKIFAITAVVLLGIGIPSGAGALGVEGVTIGISEGENGKESPEDIEFLRHSAVVAMGVVTLGELAMSDGNSPNALTVGRQARDKYNTVVDNLLRWARHKGMGELYRALDPEEFMQVKNLKATKSADFDVKFMAALLTTQNKLIEMFRAEQKAATDPDLRNYATVELPALEEQAKMTASAQAEMLAAH